jgi:hypothetical protein
MEPISANFYQIISFFVITFNFLLLQVKKMIDLEE